MAWICYLVSFFLFSIEPNAAMVVFGIGMLYHWKIWILGIGAFLIGAGSKKPLPNCTNIQYFA